MTTTPIKYAILLLLMLCTVSLLNAQATRSVDGFEPRFEIFQLPGAEAENNVQCVVQDSLGFLWFGTTNGLVRYDGESYVTYRYNPVDTNTLASSYVETIFIDSKGLFWLGHYTLNGEKGGLTLFDPKTETFTRFNYDPQNPNGISDPRPTVITEDREGYIWIGTFAGLDRYDRKTGTFKHFRHNPNDATSLSYDLVRALYVDKQGTLWVGTGFPWDGADEEGNRGGLNRYNPKTESFTRFLHDPGNPNSLADNRVRALFEDSKGNFWVGTMGNGLHQLNRRTGQFTRFGYDPAHPERLSRPYLRDVPIASQVISQVTFVHEDRAGRLWIGAFNGGLNIYDPATGKMRHFEKADAPEEFPTNFMWNIFESRDGVHWIACGVGGGVVLKVRAEQEMFPFFSNNDLQEEREYIKCITEDLNGNIWLGSDWSATPLTWFNRKTKQVHHFRYGPAPGGFPVRDIRCLLTDRDGFIWVGTDNGIFKIHPENGIVRHFKHIPDNKNTLSATNIEALIQDRQGYIWAGTWGGGLERIDPKTGAIQHFRHNPADANSIGGDYVIGLLSGQDGSIWLAGGHPVNDRETRRIVDRLNPASGQVRHYKPQGEIDPPGFTLVELNDDIWYSAFPNGLQRLNKITGKVTEYSVDDINGDWSNNIISLAKGKDGRLWMTTWDAILCFDPAKETFFKYTRAHGLQITSFGTRGYFISAKGEHMVSGQGGLHTFYPEQLTTQQNNRLPDVRITGFLLKNELVKPGKNGLLERPVWETGAIELAHNQNTFAFNVACFDFDNPKGNLLEFQLVPYDPDWRSDLREGQASYFNVPPGEYIFRVRGANSKGIWGAEMIELHVTVHPPWWATWWAYSMYALLVLGLVYGIYRILLRRRLAQAETIRLQELDSVKTKLYTNITHEFRTPLTIISGMADQVRENPTEWFAEGLDMIKRNSNRLLGLVNQMLDLAKLESGKMNLQLQQGDVVNYLKYLVESFHSFADSKGVKMHFHSDLDALTMDFDPEKLQQVVTNLLSNAVKFTPVGGHIYVDVRLQNNDPRLHQPGSPDGSISGVEIRVRDTGIGIPEDQLLHVFDRFYQADDSNTRHGEGTGIGLALTKELVKLMHGVISAKSQAGKGAEFSVLLPVRTEATVVAAPLIPKHIQKTEQQGPVRQARKIEKKQNGHPVLLLAEDNPDVVAYLASCLAGDYQLLVARDGQEAIDIATEQVPDLLITDVMMPYKDGFEVCRTLREDAHTSHIPIVMLTAKADVESKLEGLEHGADAYLAKPFNKEELLLRIRKLLERRQELQQYYLGLAGIAVDSQPVRDIPAMPETENQFVLDVRAIVEAHLDDGSFDVDQLCRKMAMSHSQLHRKLSALTGFPATKFIRYVRLNKAKELLQNPALSITAVAYDTGFNDPSYFGRVFKQEFGMTPQEWREP
ncbi:MAG: response regulator [Lewinellaceae bacterium]|nr:response regulator [Lewinellaceae bacterium]